MAKIYYENDANLELLKGKTIGIIGFGSQGHAHALNLRDNHQNVMVGLYSGSNSWQKAQMAGLRVGTVEEVAREADILMVLAPDQVQKQIYYESIEAGHPLQPDRRAQGRGRDDDRTQGARPRHARAVREGRRRTGARRRAPERHGERVAAGARLRQGRRLGQGGNHRDDVRGGDRDGPLRRADGALRRRHAADQDGVRDAGAGRLPAGDRLLRVPARAEAARRLHPRRRHGLHALHDLRHGRVRRLHSTSTCART